MNMLKNSRFWCWLVLILGPVLHMQGQSYLQERRAEAYDCNLPEETRLEALQWLADFYHDTSFKVGDRDSAMYYAERYREDAQSSSSLYHQIKSLYQLGNILRFIDREAEAEPLYREANVLNKDTGFRDLEVDILWGIAQSLRPDRNPENMDSARFYYHQALRLAESYHDSYRQVKNAQYLAWSVFSWVKEKDTAQYLAYLNQALEVDPKDGGLALCHLAQIAIGLGRYHLRLKEDSLAKIFLGRGIQYLNQVQDPSIGQKVMKEYIALGSYFENLGLFAKSSEAYLMAVKLARHYGAEATKASALYDLGRLSRTDFAKSIRYYEWCRTYSDSIGEVGYYALALNNMAILYNRSNNQDKALKLYNQADSSIRVNLANGRLSLRGRGIRTYKGPANNAGFIYLYRGQFEEAKAKFFWAWYAARKWGYTYDRANAVGAIARLYERQEIVDSARYYFGLQAQTMDSLPNRSSAYSWLIGMYHTQAGFYLRQGDPTYAVDNFYPLFLEYQKEDQVYTSYTRSYASTMYQAFKMLGRFEDALEMANLYYRVRDSLDREENQQATFRFDLEQKALQDSLANVQSQVELKAEFDRQVRLRNYLLVALLALIVGGVFWLQYRRQRQKAEEKEEQLKATEELNQRLQQVDKLKDQFLANTSHELRTPLNGIIGISEGLLDHESIPPQELRENLGMVVASGKRLASLVNDLLDFSRIKNADLALRQRPTGLRALVDVVLQVSYPLTSGKDLQLRNEVPLDMPAAFADEDRLSQVLYNLVGNAIKFTESGEVRVSAQVKDDQILMSVSDTGIGIPENKREAIFQEFTQADGSIQREFAGTGLGLSISRQLIRAHGGEMWVESEMGQGSLFFFTLPISEQLAEVKPELNRLTPLMPSQVALGAKLMDGPQPQGRFRILIVDDEPINHQVLKNHLRGQQFSLHSAMNGFEALEMLNQSELRYDLVLLDVMMPRMSGYEVAQKIRERFLPSELPIILVTAKNQVADLVKGLETGANDYLAKPFSKDEFMARLKTHLNLRKINQATSRFVPTEFIRTLGKEGITEVMLGDHTAQEVTVMFTDIRDYTGLAEKMTPEENFRFVEAYVRRMGPLIQDHQGFINQYLGDGIMALFQRSSQDALAAAVAMQQAISQYNEERSDQQRRPLMVGMGLHTGPLVMGIIGDQRRSDATVIADTVNTASRLEGLTKYYGSKILISETSHSQLDGASQSHTRYLGLVQVKGRRQPMGIYECFAADSPELIKLKLDHQTHFQQGLAAFLKGEMEQAGQQFGPLAGQGDTVAQYLLTKTLYHRSKGLPKNWDGVDVMERK